MRNVILILATTLVATFANAQIYLERTITTKCRIVTNTHEQDCGKLPLVFSDTLVELYNDDLTLYKTIRIADNSQQSSIKHAPHATMGGWSTGCYYFMRNIYTTDGKIAFLRLSSNNMAIYNEDGIIVFNFNKLYDQFSILPVNGKWKFVGQKYGEEGIDVYSLPGNGVTEELSEIQSPRRNTRKYMHNNQILIENSDKTYTLQGQEVR